MIIANQSKELTSSVTIASTGLPKFDGTIFALIWLEDVVDGYDGKFWDGSAWTVGVQTFPTATHVKGGVWSYTLPAAATDGEVGSIVHWIMADSNSEADITTISSNGEHRVMVNDGYGLTAGQVETIVNSVWDGLKADHTSSATFGSLGSMESNIRGADSDTLESLSDQMDQIAIPSEVSFRTWEINKDITVNLFVTDPDTGEGLTGQVSFISLTIRRSVDDFYWTGSIWTSTVTTLTMTENDATNSPGRYSFILDKTGNTQANAYIAHAHIENPPTITGDTYEIHVSQLPFAVASDLRVYEAEPA
jgi:hypothetical protein